MRSAVAVPDAVAWRETARGLLAAEVAPAEVAWTAPGATASLFGDGDALPAPRTAARAHVPRRFVELADEAILHRDAPHALLYRILWRITHGEHGLVDDAADPDVRALTLLARQVRRDEEKMRAFVRFHEVEPGQFVAWYAPDHHVIAPAAAFFRARFPVMRWAILTPERSVTWEGGGDAGELAFGPGVPRHAAPAADDLEDIWRTYYAATFNPARANPKLMRQHMPQRFWPQMPESSVIPALLARAAPRVGAMIDPGAAVPSERSLPVLRDAAARCGMCELCGPATQTVFGEGPADASIVLVGEQPGDAEDLAGRPFVGPAGHVLDAALAHAGLPRESVYLTNAVKHFRFLPRGKQRLHQRATSEQIRACKPWLAAELETIRPRIVVCLGATAALSLIGSKFRISRDRGQWVQTHWSDALIATHHPAAILRVEDDMRPRYEAELRADLAAARAKLTELAGREAGARSSISSIS